MLTVQRLTWELISQLVEQWYAALEEDELGDQLLNTLQTNTRIYELAVNPMLLSLIALVQYIRRLIPDRRDVLYDECVKILVERRFAPHHVQQRYNRVLPGEEAVRLLRGIALRMHRRGLREVPRNEFEEDLIPAVLEETMAESQAAAVPPVQLLRNIEQRSQLIVERGFNEDGQPVMAFSHLTFQEYLTSVALKELTSEKGEGVVSEDLISEYEANREQWEEVALLYAAQLDGPLRQTFLKRLYPEQETVHNIDK